MGAGRKKESFTLGERTKSSTNTVNSSISARNLRKVDLGAIIFGCTHSTMRECLTDQLFGLPGPHFSYIRNIVPGLPLFLFNYSERKLYGIFEAASQGQMNINPYGWSSNGFTRTHYPAQVRIRIRMQCRPLLEKQFKPIILDNYYSPSHFWFELDHTQAGGLLSMFASSPVIGSATAAFPQNAASALPQNAAKRSTLFRAVPDPITIHEEENSEPSVSQSDFPHSDQSNMESGSSGDNPCTVYLKLKQLAIELEHSNSSPMDHAEDIAVPRETNDMHSEDERSSSELSVSAEKYEGILVNSSDLQSVLCQLRQGMEELKDFSREQLQKTSMVEKKLATSDLHLQLLKDRVKLLESQLDLSTTFVDETHESFDELHSRADEHIFLIGGYDGNSWLSALDCYSPSKDIMRSLRPMSSVRSHASVAVLNGHIYIFGGGNGDFWYDTVESYNPFSNEWTSRPSLNEKKGSLAGATLHNKLFAIGGGNGVECFSDIEMFDPILGRWIHIQSMLQKRFAPAAAELDGVLYAVGGYDGKDYLKSAERYDPRDVSWTRLSSMNTRRGCHSLVTFNGKLYALGGHDGTKMIPSVEVFDPRTGSWMIGDPMNQSRGYSAAAVIGESIYVFGGMNVGQNILDSVECYKEGHGWQVTNLRAIGRRCFFSAIVL